VIAEHGRSSSGYGIDSLPDIGLSRLPTRRIYEEYLLLSTTWFDLLRHPHHLGKPGVASRWFDRIAARLLNGTRLVVNRQPHRLAEIEFYLYSPEHPDVFSHREPIQHHAGRWYFHRTHGVYRGGSFKGIDVSFGNLRSFGGILFRSIETPEQVLINGPSLIVDHLLDLTGAESVGQLDMAIRGRLAWDETNLLYLEWFDPPIEREVFHSARVGLSLKRTKSPEATDFIMRPYRYLTEPRRIAKGKALLVLARHMLGDDTECIAALTGCPRKSIARYIEDFEAGKLEADFSAYFGIDLGTKELCRLYGTWHQRMAGE
jgi:hypothetical protein